jgi:hypothetical protein
VSKDLSYYLERPERVVELSDEQIDSWIAEYPFVQSFRWLKARRDLDLNRADMRESIRSAACYSDDLVFLKYQLLRDSGTMKDFQSGAHDWVLENNAVVLSSIEAETKVAIKKLEKDQLVADAVEKKDPAPIAQAPKPITKEKKKKEEPLAPLLSQAEKVKQIDDILGEYNDQLSDFSLWLISQKEDQKKSAKVEEEEKEKQT